jgi:mannose/fructose/N-acetylgalactosamine-specific phosphotransferase system component IIB
MIDGSKERQGVTRIALFRVDDRLIHGQVVVKWLRHIPCDEIWVVDDDLAADDFMQQVLRLAAPPGVLVRIAPVHEAATLLLPSRSAGGTALLLVRSPQAALELLDQGLEFRELNIGGLASGPQTARLYKSISASPEQIAALQSIQERGVRVYFQMVPEEHPAEMAEVLPAQQLRSKVAASQHS